MFKIQTINRHRLKTDGKGVTTLIGLYGCPLSCRYCINMEVLSKRSFRLVSPEKLLEEVMIDYCYFVGTGGGLTFGGGESLIHYQSILDLFEILPEGISINIETSLNYEMSDDAFLSLVAKCESIIADIKTLDSVLYKEYTGKSNRAVIRHLELIRKHNMCDKIFLRVPVIPGYKTLEEARKEADMLEEMGYRNIEIFYYVIRDYMK